MRRLGAPVLALYTGLAAAGLIAALAVGRVEAVALATPFVLALLAGATLGRDPELEVRLAVDRSRAVEGETLTATLELFSPVGIDRLDVLLLLPEVAVVDGGAARAVSLRKGERRAIELELRPESWSALEIGPVLCRVGDVLGMRSWAGELGERQFVRVYPREETLRSLVPPLETQVFAGNRVARTKGEGIEFADLRAWQSGDRQRHVNWRASARRGALWVNEQHPERNSDLVLFIDSYVDARGTGSVSGTNERAVRAAATLAHGYLDHKDRVGLIGFGGYLTWLVPATGLRQLYAIVDTLIESDIVHSYARRGFTVIPRRTLPPKALVVALTPFLDERVVNVLLDLRARGYDLVVVDVSPLDLVAPESPLEELADRLWRLSRDALRWRYEQAGVPVVTWREDAPLAVPIEEVMTYRRLARPA
jgi:uncharacterized protein (DUF58 family)